MSDAELRTERPTPHRIRKAAEAGHSTFTPELGTGLMLLFISGIIAAMWRYSAGIISAMFTHFYDLSSGDFGLSGAFSAGLQYMMRLVIPAAAVAFAAALISQLVQKGFVFSPKRMAFDVGRLAGKRDSGVVFYTVCRNIVKILLVAAVVFINIRFDLDKFLSLVTIEPASAFRLVFIAVLMMTLEIGIVFLVLAFPDYLMQRKFLHDSLKMTRQEIKEENKMLEGDSRIKNDLKKRMAAVIGSNKAANVSSADFVLTGKDGYAVAVQYRQRQFDAPVVVAKGMGITAGRIITLADENHVRVVPDDYLSRAIYYDVEVGTELPGKYFMVVSRIMADMEKL